MEMKEANNLAKQLARKSHFITREVAQILCLYSDYCEAGVLTRRGFRELIQNNFKITDKLTLDRSFHIFDSVGNGFVNTLALLRSHCVCSMWMSRAVGRN